MRKLLTVLALLPVLAAIGSAQVLDFAPIRVPGAAFSGPTNLPLYSGGFGGFINLPIAAYRPLDFDLGRVPMFSIQKGIGLAGFKMDVDPATIGALTMATVEGPSTAGGGGSSAATAKKKDSRGIERLIEKLRDRKEDNFGKLEALTDEERAQMDKALKTAAELAIDSKPSKIAWKEYQDAKTAHDEAMNGILAGGGDDKALREALQSASARMEDARKTHELAQNIREDAVSFITMVGILSLHDLKTRQLAEVYLDAMRYSLSDISVSARVAYTSFERQRSSFRPVEGREKIAELAIEKYRMVFK